MTAADLARGALRGALDGALAAMTMSGLRSLTARVGPVDATPPEEVVDRRAPAPVRALPQDRREAVAVLAHWAYGAGGGALHAALPTGLTRRRWFGAAYGAALWLGYELALAPALGLHRRASRSAGEQALVAADHLLYGAVLGRLSRRR